MIGPYIHRASGLMVEIELGDKRNFVASVPELPGCVAACPTFDETAAEIDLAIRTVLDIIKRDDHARHALLLQSSTFNDADFDVVLGADARTSQSLA